MAVQTLPVEQSKIDTSRYECVDGQLVERPLPNDIHADIQFAVTALLKRSITEFQLPFAARQEWTLDEDDQPRHNWMTPDVLVSEPERIATNRHALPPAHLAVEVLSEGQTFEQMFGKAQRYFAWGMKHVWIIDPVMRKACSIDSGHPTSVMWVEHEYEFLSAGRLRLTLDEIFTFQI